MLPLHPMFKKYLRGTEPKGIRDVCDKCIHSYNLETCVSRPESAQCVDNIGWDRTIDLEAVEVRVTAYGKICDEKYKRLCVDEETVART